MRIKTIIKAIVFCLSIILIWCVTPPEASSSNLTIFKLILTGAVVWYYRSSSTSSFSKFLHSAKTVSITSARSLQQIVHIIFDYIGRPARKFVEWSCEINLPEYSQCRPTILDQVKPARQQACRAYNVVSFFGFVFCYLTVLDDRNLVATLCAIFIASTLIVISRHIFSCAPVHIYIALCAFLVSSFVELVDTTPRETLGWLQPYFSVKLSFVTFSLSPLQMAYIVVSIALLISYGSLCTHIHQLVCPNQSGT